jgi:hypothetical protein
MLRLLNSDKLTLYISAKAYCYHCYSQLTIKVNCHFSCYKNSIFQRVCASFLSAYLAKYLVKLNTNQENHLEPFYTIFDLECNSKFYTICTEI